MVAAVLAADGIRVNVVAPGGIDTPLPGEAATEHLASGTREVDWRLLMDAAGARYGAMPPRDVAEAIVFLASDAAASITGAVLAVDRGTTC